MKAIILFVFIIFLSKVSSIPVICISTYPPLVLSTDCQNLQLYKLNQNLCDSELQKLDVDLNGDTQSFWFQHHANGIPVTQFTKKLLQSLPNLPKVISEICPFEDFSHNNFLGLNGEFDHLHEVVFSVLNANGLSGNKGIYQNFYQTAPVVNYISFETEPSLSMKDLNTNLGFFNDQANYTVYSAKIYSQYCGEIPGEVIKAESKLALENPFKHTIDMVTFLIYDVLNTPVPEDQKVKEYHELLEVCLKNDVDNKTHHVVVDRVAIGDGKLKFWNSRINMYYIGEGDGCELESNQWADVKSGICNVTGQPCLIARTGKTNLNYNMNKVIKLSTDFLLNYKIFNSVFNCQHFATNAWNAIANDTLDFENWEIMGVHSPFTNLEPKISFLDYPK